MGTRCWLWLCNQILHGAVAAGSTSWHSFALLQFSYGRLREDILHDWQVFGWFLQPGDVRRTPSFNLSKLPIHRRRFWSGRIQGTLTKGIDQFKALTRLGVVSHWLTSVPTSRSLHGRAEVTKLMKHTKANILPKGGVGGGEEPRGTRCDDPFNQPDNEVMYHWRDNPHSK